MRWFALVAAALALLLRFTWHSTAAIAIPVGNDTHRGFPITSVVFWLLVLVSCFLAPSPRQCSPTFGIALKTSALKGFTLFLGPRLLVVEDWPACTDRVSKAALGRLLASHGANCHPSATYLHFEHRIE